MEPPGTARGLPRPDGEMHDILTMRGPWKVEVGELMRQRGIVRLSVCDLYGWKGHSIGFLRTLPDLKELQLRCFVLFDISPLHSLSKLQTLVLLVRFPGELNFSRFPLIEHLLIDWSPRARSLLRAETLRHLHLNSCFDFRDLSPLSALRRLESSGMADGSLESLDGIEALDQLNTLHRRAYPNFALLRRCEKHRDCGDSWSNVVPALIRSAPGPNCLFCRTWIFRLIHPTGRKRIASVASGSVRGSVRASGDTRLISDEGNERPERPGTSMSKPVKSETGR